MIKLDTNPFSRLKPQPIKLKPWRKNAPPALNSDPVKAIMNFARYAGLKTIPARTAEKLKHDEYFRYCFYMLNTPDREISKSLVRLLKNPDSMTDSDLALGLSHYLNNFVTYMPGTTGLMAEIFTRSSNMRQIRDSVHGILKEKGLFERALELRNVSGDAQQLAFLKLSLDIFRVMVEVKGYAPEVLWR